MTIAYESVDSEIILRDGNLEDLGEISKFISLEATITLNDVGSWLITMRPDDFRSLEQLDMLCGINVYRDKELIFDGPITDIKNTYVSGEPLISLIGATDNQYLKDAVCYPVVSGPITIGGGVYFSDIADVNQTLTVDSAFQGYDTRSGPAQIVMQQLVDYNIGPHACKYTVAVPEGTYNINRSLSNLVIGPGGGIGLPITSNARGDNLLTQLQSIAAAGCVNFQITLHGGPYSDFDGTWLEFDTFIGRDLTQTVELSVESGTLKEYEYIVSRPKGNLIIAAGPNVQANQQFWFGADPDSIAQYGMVEEWASGASANSQDTVDEINTEMGASVNTSLLNDAYTTSVTLTLQETDQLRFKRDFDLGDKVRVWVDDIPVDETVRQLYYVLSSSGTASGGSLVTTFKPRQTSKAVQQIRQNTEAINRLMLQKG